MTDSHINTPRSMGMGEAVKVCFKKYATFKGRARRAEFWWFYLFTFLLAAVTAIIDGLIFGFGETDPAPLNAISSLAVLLPTIAATVRRFHDTGRSGWMIVLPVIGVAIIIVGGSIGWDPILWIGVIAVIVASIIQLVWLCQASEPGTNQYGPNPITDPDGQNIAEVFE